MKQKIILTFVVIAVAAFLSGYGLGNLNDNSDSLTTNEIINVSSEGKKIKQYRSRIGKVEITLENSEPSLNLYPNTENPKSEP